MASTHFCLAKPGDQYVIYQPDDEPIIVSGLQVGAFYKYELYDTKQSTVVAEGRIRASAAIETFKVGRKGSVLYIERIITR